MFVVIRQLKVAYASAGIAASNFRNKDGSFSFNISQGLAGSWLCIQEICDFIVSLKRYSNRGSKEGLSMVGNCQLFEFAIRRCLILVLHVLRSEIILELTNNVCALCLTVMQIVIILTDIT